MRNPSIRPPHAQHLYEFLPFVAISQLIWKLVDLKIVDTLLYFVLFVSEKTLHAEHAFNQQEIYTIQRAKGGQAFKL